MFPYPQAEASLEERLQQLQSRLCAREGEAALLRARVEELRGEAAHSASVAQGMAAARAEAEAQVSSIVKDTFENCGSRVLQVYSHHKSLMALTRRESGSKGRQRRV